MLYNHRTKVFIKQKPNYQSEIGPSANEPKKNPTKKSVVDSEFKDSSSQTKFHYKQNKSQFILYILTTSIKLTVF